MVPRTKDEVSLPHARAPRLSWSTLAPDLQCNDGCLTCSRCQGRQRLMRRHPVRRPRAALLDQEALPSAAVRACFHGPCSSAGIISRVWEVAGRVHMACCDCRAHQCWRLQFLRIQRPGANADKCFLAPERRAWHAVLWAARMYDCVDGTLQQCISVWIRHLHICKMLHVRVGMYIRGMCVEVNVAYHRRQIG
jgi:hypothetical protein